MVYDVSKRGIHKIKTTLQCKDFIGHITKEVGGNLHGRDILDYDFETDDFEGKFASNDCNLRYDYETETFSVTLKNAEGAELKLNYMSPDAMSNMIVGLEFIDFIVE